MSPKSDMAKAIAYGTRRWPALCRFLGDGRLEIDNNIAERALRGVAVGRRNWLFAGSRAGGERAAAIYTVIQTCKANGVEPQTYIADVIAKVADDCLSLQSHSQSFNPPTLWRVGIRRTSRHGKCCRTFPQLRCPAITSHV